MRDTSPLSLGYVIPMVIGGAMISMVLRWATRITSRVEIDDTHLTRKVLFYTFWSVPILSITDIGRGLGISGRYRPLALFGYVFKTNDGAFYTIPHNLVQADIFMKDLQAKNPRLVINEPATQLNDEYRQKNGARRMIISLILTVIICAVLIYVIYVFSPKGSL